MIDFSGMKAAVIRLPDKMERAMLGYGKTAAAKLEAEAKTNRPWRDRTAQARQRIKGDCERTDKGIRLTLSHGVDYGPDLEFRHQKRYAIIYPTLRRMAPEILRGFGETMGGKF